MTAIDLSFLKQGNLIETSRVKSPHFNFQSITSWKKDLTDSKATQGSLEEQYTVRKTTDTIYEENRPSTTVILQQVGQHHTQMNQLKALEDLLKSN